MGPSFFFTHIYGVVAALSGTKGLSPDCSTV